MKHITAVFVLTAFLILPFVSFAESRKDILGGWVLSEKWGGYMGVAILFDKDEYTYWFYSDVNYPGKPRYPIKGKYSIEGNKITLAKVPGLYTDKWYLIDYQKEKCLIPDNEYSKLAEGKPFDDSRLLHFDKLFDTEDPFAYQMGGYNTLESRKKYIEDLKKEKLEFIKHMDIEAKKLLDKFNASEDSKKLGGLFTVDDYDKTVVLEEYDFELRKSVGIVSYTLKTPVDFKGFPRDFAIKVYRDDERNPHYKLVKCKLK
ncbi:MAG: hypothetical protein A2020_00855 [Lentisphaerae bacterium GWF2_45_14]|nr:MAG: hypothetical protein A2020_00855 [Lentisphaerae bacterium GWF2_45_14]